MGLFPIFMKLEGVSCLVVGGGKVAERKVRSLLDAEARVTLIAPEATEGLRSLASSGRITWLKKPYQSGDLDGFRLAVAAANSREVNRLVYEEAVERGVPMNSVDDPERSSFFFPAVARKGSLVIAISTSGTAPGFARRLREHIEKKLYSGLEKDLSEAQALRTRLMECSEDAAERRKELERKLQTLAGEIIKKIENS